MPNSIPLWTSFALARQLSDEAANPGGTQRQGDTVGRDIDPLDQEPQDARLLGRVQLVPDRLKRPEGFDDIALLELGVLSCAVLPAHRGDGPRDQLGRREQPTYLSENEALHLAGGD
jgi:hypothetical protein